MAQAHSIEALGCIAATLQDGLLQSVSPRPGEPEVISVFPAWPMAWDASFSLLARGGFIVTSAVVDGEVAFVEIDSRTGETCRLRNPWGRPCQVSDDGCGSWVLSDEVLCFYTARGARYRIVRAGGSGPSPRTLTVPANASRASSYAYALPNGRVATGRIGRGI